jgi:hypothetical protein
MLLVETVAFRQGYIPDEMPISFVGTIFSSERSIPILMIHASEKR